MAAFLLLLLAILSRLVPHLLGVSAWGVSALGGGLLFFGSRLGVRQRWMAVLAVPPIAAMDWYLTTVVYGFPFHAAGYVVPWLWYAGVAWFGGAALRRRPSALRVVGAAAGSATGFFLLSNGAVWLGGAMYPRTIAGLLACYAAGVPFYRNDAVATVLLCAVLFGLPALARRLAVGTSAHNAAL